VVIVAAAAPAVCAADAESCSGTVIYILINVGQLTLQVDVENVAVLEGA
jgi:hypothetical protein